MVTTDVVVLGAGYGGLQTVQQLSKYFKERKDIRLVLIDQHPYHTLMTQLYEPAVGTKQAKDIMVPLEDILPQDEVSFIEGKVAAIDLAKRQVLVEGLAKPVSFTYLVIALGSRTEYFGIEGLQEYSHSLNNIQTAQRIFQRIRDILAESEDRATFVVGGGGLTGVEFAGELADWLRDSGQQNAGQVILIEGANQLLPGMSQEICQYAQRTLEELGVEVITGVFVKKVTKESVYLSSGRIVPYSLLMWAGGISGHAVLQTSGLPTDHRGRLLVNEFLQTVGDSRIYGVGDSALVKDPVTGRPIIPTAQTAMQQARAAAYNIYAEINRLPKKVFRPGFVILCITIGKNRGLGESLGEGDKITIKGLPAAWLKKLIPHKYFYTLGGLKLLRKRLKK